MATSLRSVQNQFSGEVTLDVVNAAAENEASPASVEIITLAEGANTITPPDVDGVDVKGVTIIPPSANAALITLKGISGDTGIPLHLTDPTSIGLDSTLTTFVLTAAEEIVGLRLIWS